MTNKKEGNADDDAKDRIAYPTVQVLCVNGSNSIITKIVTIDSLKMLRLVSVTAL